MIMLALLGKYLQETILLTLTALGIYLFKDLTHLHEKVPSDYSTGSD